jgi:hypothetical protein
MAHSEVSQDNYGKVWFQHGTSGCRRIPARHYGSCAPDQFEPDPNSVRCSILTATSGGPAGRALPYR